tara:strand:+ start:215 stop:802 length:588 start_codon:yes stop_codon:yes gene_type:complete
MANTTFNGPVRSEGGFEQITKAASTGAITTNLDVDSSGNLTTTGNITGNKKVIDVTDATKELTQADSGSLVLLNRAAGVVITLPTAAVGINFRFQIAVTGTGTYSINGASTDAGYHESSNVLMSDKDSPSDEVIAAFFADGTDDDKLLLNSDGDGRFIGGYVDVTCIAATGGSFTKSWLATGILYADGTQTNPFS